MSVESAVDGALTALSEKSWTMTVSVGLAESSVDGA
jgi:hypothetical protein